jgi:hypothetical protein
MQSKASASTPSFRLVLTFAALLAGCQSAPTAPPTLQPASVDAVKQSIYYLASDELEGRGIETKGIEKAANYISGYFKGLNLEPVPGQTDYFQPFEFVTVTGLSSETSLKINGHAFAAGADFTPRVLSAENAFDGPVVFVGYGLSGAKDLGGKDYDDYANVDVNGKVAIALRFEPHDEQGRSRFAKEGWSDHATVERKATVAAEHGAIALLVVYPPTFHGPEMLSPLGRRIGGGVSIPLIEIRERVAEEMLKDAKTQDLKTLQAAIDTTFKPASMPLAGVRASGKVALERKDYHLKNVMACIPGKGKHADQYIVVGAHYDHLGRGGFGSRSPKSHEIHNGADDNASGTAAIMEMARIFSKAGPLSRSLIFVTFSGEEQGLLGSKYWVEHPPVPLDHIEAMVNLDMVGRAKNDVLQVGGTGTAAPLESILEQADAGSPLNVKTTFKDGFAPSDNTSFVIQNIPVLFFWTGYHEDYHRPTDKADKINYPDEARIIDLVAKCIVAISQRDDVKFTPSTSPATQSATQPSLAHGGASLGVVPDYSEDTTGGLKITGVSPDSPAQKAGLLGGDIIVKIDGRKIETIYDLTDVLAQGVPGQVVKITVLRKGQPVTLEATLTQRRSAQ